MYQNPHMTKIKLITKSSVIKMERENWSPLEYYFVTIGTSIGFGCIWRFPSLVFENGLFIRRRRIYISLHFHPCHNDFPNDVRRNRGRPIFPQGSAWNYPWIFSQMARCCLPRNIRTTRCQQLLHLSNGLPCHLYSWCLCWKTRLS